MTTLAARIEAAAPKLTARIVAEMYRNPFWIERFGERGRTFTAQDGNYHLSFLVQAIVADDPQVFASYARWLQSVLTTRGMCTLHIDENFARLARAIDDSIADAADAVACIDSGRAALRYDEGRAAARDLQNAAARLADAATAELYRRHPEWSERWGPAGRERCRQDLDYHLSYLADAAAVSQPAVFIDYAVWIAGFLERRNIPVAHSVETLDVLSGTLDGESSVSADTRETARSWIADATGRLRA